MQCANGFSVTRPSLNRSFTIRHAASLPLRHHSRTQSQLATSVKRHSVPRTWKSRVGLSLVHNTSHSYAALATICEHTTAPHRAAPRHAARIDPSSKLAARRGAADAARPRMYVYPLVSAVSHIGITKERYQRIHRNAGIVLKFADFPKNASFKSYGVLCLPRAAPAS